MVVLIYGLLAATLGVVVGFGIGRYWALAVPLIGASVLWWTSGPDHQSGDLRTIAFWTVVIFGVAGTAGGLSLRRARASGVEVRKVMVRGEDP